MLSLVGWGPLGAPPGWQSAAPGWQRAAKSHRGIKRLLQRDQPGRISLLRSAMALLDSLTGRALLLAAAPGLQSHLHATRPWNTLLKIKLLHVLYEVLLQSAGLPSAGRHRVFFRSTISACGLPNRVCHTASRVSQGTDAATAQALCNLQMRPRHLSDAACHVLAG